MSIGRIVKLTDFTKDATALPENVLRGEVYYGADGRRVGKARTIDSLVVLAAARDLPDREAGAALQLSQRLETVVCVTDYTYSETQHNEQVLYTAYPLITFSVPGMQIKGVTLAGDYTGSQAYFPWSSEDMILTIRETHQEAAHGVYIQNADGEQMDVGFSISQIMNDIVICATVPATKWCWNRDLSISFELTQK